MSSPPKQKRVSSKYTYEERKVLQAFKKEYRSQPNKAERANMFRSRILPAISNYWKDNGNAPVDEKDLSQRVKVYFKIFPTFRIIFIFFTVRNLGHGLATTGDRSLRMKAATRLGFGTQS